MGDGDQGRATQAPGRPTGGFAFLERMGLRTLVAEPGRCVLLAPLAGNENHVGIMYAGALYSLAEVPGGVLFRVSFDVERFFPIVTASTIRYLLPARSDVTVEARMDAAEVDRLQAEAEAQGKARYELDVELRDVEERVVATMTSSYQLRTHGSLR